MGKQKKKQSVAPVYAFGLTWLIGSLILGWGTGRCIFVAVLISWMVSATVKNRAAKQKQAPQTAQQPKATQKESEPAPTPKEAPKQKAPEEKPLTGNPELDAVIREGHASVAKIRQLNDEIPDFKLSAQLKQIELLSASIIDQVEKKPDKLKEVRQFMDYYLPTTIKLLEQYVQMQDVGLKGENITNGMKQIENLLDKVIVAFQKQLDSLFERDVVDITADIQVMEQMMAAQGLTNQKDF